MPEAKQPIIVEVWVVYGLYVFSLPIQDPYPLLIEYVVHKQPVSWLQLLPH